MAVDPRALAYNLLGRSGRAFARPLSKAVLHLQHSTEAAHRVLRIRRNGTIWRLATILTSDPPTSKH